MSLLISFHSTKQLIHDFNTVNDGKELKMKGDHATMPHRKQYPAKYFLFSNQKWVFNNCSFYSMPRDFTLKAKELLACMDQQGSKYSARSSPLQKRIS